jgi:hypothetical protein
MSDLIYSELRQLSAEERKLGAEQGAHTTVLHMDGSRRPARLAPGVREILDAWTRRRVDVPCNGCTSCCHARARVHPEKEPQERLQRLDLTPHPDGKSLMLSRRPDGGCIHLGPQGCGVYEHRPTACRQLDCRVHALTARACVEYGGGHAAPTWYFDNSGDDDKLMDIVLDAAGKEYDAAGGAGDERLEARMEYGIRRLTQVWPRVLERFGEIAAAVGYAPFVRQGVRDLMRRIP